MICFYKQLDYTQMKFLGNQDALNWCLDDFNAFFFFFPYSMQILVVSLPED